MQGCVKLKARILKITLPSGQLWALLEKINESTRRTHRKRSRLNDSAEEIRESHESIYNAVAGFIEDSGYKVKVGDLKGLSIKVYLTDPCIELEVEDRSRLVSERLVQPYQLRVVSRLNGLMTERQLTYMV